MNEDKVKKIGFNVIEQKFTNFCADISLVMFANEGDLSF
jgi:hypothetical protein